MSKNFKIILILIAAAITAILFLIIVYGQDSNNSFLEKMSVKKEEPEAKIDLAALNEEYRGGISEALAEFSALKEGADLDVSRIEEIKNKALDLRVPGEFKDLHLDFVLAMVRIEDFIQTGSEEAKIAGEELIEKIKSSYPWIK